MRLVVWLLRGFLFFTLFAFALNNQQMATVRWFFGAEWQTPMVIVVLTAFAAGTVVGVLAMVPNWWRQRERAREQAPSQPQAPAPAPASVLPSDFAAEHPPREGL